MRILNLVPDEKFIDTLISEYNYFNLDARFIVLQERQASLKWIKNEERIECVVVGSREYEVLLEGHGYDILWVHSLDNVKMVFINAMSIECLNSHIVVWSSFGWDLYTQLGQNFLMRKTLLVRLKECEGLSFIKYLLRLFVGGLGVNRNLYDFTLRKCLNRIDYVSTIVPQEACFMKRILNRRTRFLRFYYAPLPPKITNYPTIDLTSRQIWVGNSTTYTNNHFDVFPMLNAYSDYDIVAPISYGSGDVNVIDKYGYSRFGKHWHPIRNFIAIGDYMKKMSKSAIFIFAHLRQQALGNILLALKMGGCVFMDMRNPIVDYLRQYDIVVYDLKDIADKMEIRCNEFKSIQMENIKKSMELFSQEEIVSSLKETFNTLNVQVGHLKNR